MIFRNAFKTFNNWIFQITFDEVHIITDVETQGRFAGGAGKEFATHYMIDYLRTGSQWMRYKYRNSSHLIEANKDVSTAIRHTLDPPIIASRIRLVPYSYYPRTVCLRTELYGCQYKGISSLDQNIYQYYKLKRVHNNSWEHQA